MMSSKDTQGIYQFVPLYTVDLFKSRMFQRELLKDNKLSCIDYHFKVIELLNNMIMCCRMDETGKVTVTKCVHEFLSSKIKIYVS